MEFFWSVFSHIWTEYGDFRSKFPYSAQIWENADQEKLRILQCIIVRINQTMEDDTSFQIMLGVDTLLQNLL